MAHRVLSADHLLPAGWETKTGKPQKEPSKQRLNPKRSQSPLLAEATAPVASAQPADPGPATLAPQASAIEQPKVVQTAFIHKLYDMVEDESNNHLISWSITNDGFVMSPSTEFSKVLSSYFKHTNISSFVRQLNMYGFHKVSDVFSSGPAGSTMWEFKHSNGSFSKGDLVGLRDIKRRASRHALIHRDTYKTGLSPLKPYTVSPRTIDGHDLISYDVRRHRSAPTSIGRPRRSERDIEEEIALLQDERRQLRKTTEDYVPSPAFPPYRLRSADSLSYAKSISGSTLYDERDIELRGLEEWLEQVQDTTKLALMEGTSSLEDMSLDTIRGAPRDRAIAEVKLDAPVGFVPKLIQVLGPPVLNELPEADVCDTDGSRIMHTKRAPSITSAKVTTALNDGVKDIQQDAPLAALQSITETRPRPTIFNASSEGASTRTSEFEARCNILKTDTNTTISSLAAMSLDDTSSSDEASTEVTLYKTPKDVMIESLVQILRKWLAAQLHRQRQNHDETITSADSSYDKVTNGEGQQNASPSSSSNFKRRQKYPDDEDNRSGRGNKRRALDTGQDDQVNPRPLFACPFHKRRPAHYQGQEWKTCREPPLSWHQVHRVKEHLLTHHVIKQQCGRCGQAFATVAALTAHQRQEVPCEIQPLRQLEGINQETAAKLSSRKGIRDLSEYDKWYHWYKILFHQEIEDDIGMLPATPYHDKCLPSIGPLEDFIRHEFVAEVQRELETVIPTQVTALMPQMTSVLRTAMQTVIDRFHQSQNNAASTNATPTVHPQASSTTQPENVRELGFGLDAQMSTSAIDHSQNSSNLTLGEQQWQNAFGAHAFDLDVLDGWTWAPSGLTTA